MSFFNLANISEMLEKECINFEYSTISGLFFVYNFWPLFIGFLTFGMLIQHKEVFYFIVFSGMVFNTLINWGLREAIGQVGPEPDCFADKQMPAYQSDFLSFLTTTIMLSSGYIYQVPLRSFRIGLLWIAGPIGICARIYLRANTPQQLMAGVGFGILEGFLYSMILLYIFTYTRIEKWFLRTNSWWRGSDFQDTMINPSQPVIISDARLERVTVKMDSYNGAARSSVQDQFAGKSSQIQRIELMRQQRRLRSVDFRVRDQRPEDEVPDVFVPHAIVNTEVQYVLSS